FVAFKVPKPDRLVIAPGNQGLAIRRDGNSKNFILVTCGGKQFHSRGCIPKPDGVIDKRSRDERFPVGRKCRCRNVATAGPKAAQLLALSPVPNAYLAAHFAGYQNLAATRKEHHVRLAFQLSDLLLLGDIPKAYRFVETSRSQGLAVGRK